nr:transposase [Tannockella kyphosi]
MYSEEKKKIAVETYIKNGTRAAPTIRELGYPSRRIIRIWYKIYTENNSIFPDKQRKPRYTKEQRKEAVEHYLNTGRCISYTTRVLGYPSRTILSRWLREDVPDFKKACLTGKSKVSYTKQKKKEILQDVVIGEKTIISLAKDHNVTPMGIYNWKNEVLSKESLEMIQDNKKKKSNIDIITLQDELSTLQKEVAKLQLEKDILETAVKVLKKVEGIDYTIISNMGKTIIINTLKDTYKIKELLVRLHISSSSYFHCVNRLKKKISIKKFVLSCMICFHNPIKHTVIVEFMVNYQTRKLVYLKRLYVKL